MQWLGRSQPLQADLHLISMQVRSLCSVRPSLPSGSLVNALFAAAQQFCLACPSWPSASFLILASPQYGENKDAITRETQALYDKAGVDPLAGEG